MGVRNVIAVAVAAWVLPANVFAQAPSAEALIAACQSRARLTDQWNPLQAERDQLAQTLRNFGFENTVAQQEALGQSADDILRENGINARKDLMAKSANEAATAMNGFLENLQTSGRALNNAERGQLAQMARRLPESARESIMAIAHAPRIPIPGSPLWLKAFEAVGHASNAYTLATTDSAGRLAWEGFMAAAGTVSPPLGLVLSNVDYAANNLWSLGQLAWTAHQIESLTTATEADLELMKRTTARMKTVAQQLGKIRAELGVLPPCDSTQLVREPSAPAEPAASGGGISGGAIAGIIAAGASIPIGVWAYEEYKKTLDEGGTGGGNTGGGNTGGGNTGGGAIATTVSGASITCTLGSAGSLTHCTGTLTARIGPSVTAGVRVTAHTEPVNIQGHAVPTTTGTGQTLVFAFTNVTGVGCQPLRTLRFTKQSDPNTIFTTWSGTINITCR